MTQSEFNEQFTRLTDEWPRAYGASKKEMFAREFAGHEYWFFKKVIDQLLRKFRAPPQVTDVWSAISEVRGEINKVEDRAFKHPQFRNHGGECLPPQENLRRWKLLTKFISDPRLRDDPDWLRRNIWPNETKEESERKYAAIILQDATTNKRRY